MQQDKIWDYYQNEGLEKRVFSDARQRFMVKYLVPGNAVLNIGVGAGVLEKLALQKSVDIYSLDPSSKTIEQIQTKLGLGDNAKTGYAQNIPFSDYKFDTVVMSEVLEHLTDEELDAALNEVFRVLKTKGILLVSTPYNESLESQHIICPECGKLFHRWGHVQSFDKSRMRDTLSSKGFLLKNIFVTSFVDWKRKGLGNLLKSTVRISLAKMRQQIADPHLVVVAVKGGIESSDT
jgi:2-polyprenyl-3-methyl-5-hydroxy-6-metoxy-1,4-benzoquinol methylase